jgi:hypothetical protein
MILFLEQRAFVKNRGPWLNLYLAEGMVSAIADQSVTNGKSFSLNSSRDKTPSQTNSSRA